MQVQLAQQKVGYFSCSPQVSPYLSADQRDAGCSRTHTRTHLLKLYMDAMMRAILLMRSPLPPIMAMNWKPSGTMSEMRTMKPVTSTGKTLR